MLEGGRIALFSCGPERRIKMRLKDFVQFSIHTIQHKYTNSRMYYKNQT